MYVQILCRVKYLFSFLLNAIVYGKICPLNCYTQFIPKLRSSVLIIHHCNITFKILRMVCKDIKLLTDRYYHWCPIFKCADTVVVSYIHVRICEVHIFIHWSIWIRFLVRLFGEFCFPNFVDIYNQGFQAGYHYKLTKVEFVSVMM